MKKLMKFFAYTAIVVIVIWVFQNLNLYSKNNEMIISAFSHTKASLQQLDINIRGAFTNEAAMTHFEEDISCIFKSNSTVKKWTNINVITYQQDIDNGIMKIIIQKRENKTEKDLVVINITLFSNYKQFNSITNTIQGIFKKYGIKPTMTILMLGKYSGKLNKIEMKQMVDTIYNDLEARKIEKYEDDFQLGYTGYTSHIKHLPYINSGGERVNLDIRLRYNAYENKTYLYFGTPIIEVET